MNKRQFNARAAGWLLGILLLLGAGLAFLHSYQIVRHAAVVLRQADKAVDQDRPEQALRYYSLYLTYHPDDVDARARYGLALEKYADGPGDLEQAVVNFDQVLRRDPTRKDVRFRLIHCLIHLQRLPEAIGHAEKLLPDWDRKGELEHILGWCCEADKRYDQAAEWFRKAIAQDAKRIESYAMLADILRRDPDGGDKTMGLMDAMVQANPDSYRAYLLRRHNRLLLNKDEKRSDLARADDDLKEAMKLAPREPDVVLAAAASAQQRGQVDQARSLLNSGLEAHPGEPALYKALAQVEISAGRSDPERLTVARNTLQRGIGKVAEPWELLVLLTDLQIDLGERAAAEQSIADLRRRGPTSPLPDYFQARLCMSRGQWSEAITLLERTRERVSGTVWSARVHLQLGVCFRQIGDAEQQLIAFGRAVKDDPSLVLARAGMGSALLALGRLDESLEFLKQVTKTPPLSWAERVLWQRPRTSSDVPAEAWTDLARCLLQRNLRRPDSERNWAEVNLALEEAARRQPRSVDTVILQAEIAAAEKNFDQAQALLEKARGDFPGNVPLQCALADLMLRQRDFAGAVAVLDRAEKELGPSLALRQARLRLWGTLPSEQNRREVAVLGENLQNFAPAERARLLRDLAETWLRLSDPSAAEKCWRRLIEEQPFDLRARLSLLELTLQSGRIDQARQLVADIRKVEGEKGTTWHYGAAALLLAESQGPGSWKLDQARKHLAECRRVRRDWSRVPLLEANIDELEGRFDEAINHYQEAFQLGERSPRMVYRLVKLLQERRELRTAESIFRTFEEQGPPQPDLARLGAEVALASGDLNRALALGRLAVPANSRDYRDYLWLAHLHQAAGKFDLANDLLAEARSFAPQAPDVWEAIVRHLALSGRADEAPRLMGQVPRFVRGDRLAFTLARCHEVLGNVDEAERFYRQAMSARPDDHALLAAAADFFRQSDQPDKAVPLLEKLLAPSSTAPFALQAPARQQLALILAGTGQPDGVKRALSLLAVGAYPDDECTRYIVLGFDAAKRDEAIKLFDEFRKRNPISAEEMFWFARVLSAAGQPERARDLLRDLLSSRGDNPQYLASYVRNLRQGGDLPGAAIYGRKLERLEPNSPRTRELKAR